MSESQRPIRLMVVDDHPIVREGLVSILNRQSDMCVVAEAASGKEALALFRRHRPDVTVIDWFMPGSDGLAAIQEIRQEAAGACILVMSAYECEEYLYQALKAGAKGFLTKTMPYEQMLKAIRAVHGGSTFVTTEMASQLAGRMTRQELTRREKEVLEGIASGRSNLEIGRMLFITEGTVKAHINSILGKLGVGDRTQATITAIQRGLIPYPDGGANSRNTG
jgi:DNA-binding NarL/FixJ family response regulator